MRPPGSPQELERRRHRALALLAEGLAPVDAAHRLGVDRRSVRRWKAAHRRQGDAGLRATGFPTDLWTCPRVAAVIHRRFRVRYHVDHLGRLLHALGWSPQHPTRRALERDEAGIRHWIKVHWSQVKKTRRAAGPPSSSSTKPAC